MFNLIHFMTFLHTRWRFRNSTLTKILKKVREILFTFKLNSAELLSF